MESILNYKRSQDEDFYKLLGCDELSTIEQISCEYKTKALACHPDKHPDNPDAASTFAEIQRAKEVLTDPAKKADYDRWRKCGIAISYKDWLAKKNSIHTIFLKHGRVKLRTTCLQSFEIMTFERLHRLKFINVLDSS